MNVFWPSFGRKESSHRREWNNFDTNCLTVRKTHHESQSWAASRVLKIEWENCAPVLLCLTSRSFYIRPNQTDSELQTYLKEPLTEASDHLRESYWKILHWTALNLNEVSANRNNACSTSTLLSEVFLEMAADVSPQNFRWNSVTETQLANNYTAPRQKGNGMLNWIGELIKRVINCNVFGNEP